MTRLFFPLVLFCTIAPLVLFCFMSDEVDMGRMVEKETVAAVDFWTSRDVTCIIPGILIYFVFFRHSIFD
jgi:hypothetical protein